MKNLFAITAATAALLITSAGAATADELIDIKGTDVAGLVEANVDLDANVL